LPSAASRDKSSRSEQAALTFAARLSSRSRPIVLLMDFDGHPVVVYTMQRHGFLHLHLPQSIERQRADLCWQWKGRAHFTMKQKRKRKKPDARTPEAVAKFKELFLKQLALGRSPGVAARNVRIARATAYGWKKEDPEFDAAWKDAVETGLDVIETSVYDSALAGNSSDA
jgi:hypothetical protein